MPRIAASLLRSRSPLAVVLTAATLGVALTLAGCHKGPQDGVVATVNGHPIQRTEVDRVYNAQFASNPQQQAPSGDTADAARLQILQELIGREMVEQRAAKLNLTASNDEVDAKLNEIKAPYTEEQFQQKLKANGQTLDDLRHDIRMSLTETKLFNKEINSKITVKDSDVTAYYNQHKAEYNLIDNQYHLAQIITTISGSPNTSNLQNSKSTSDADARKKIQAIKNRLDAGEDFSALAINFSENPQTQPNGGDMGSLSEAQLRSTPALYNALLKLKPGQYTDVIPFPDQQGKLAGYAIFKLIDKAPAGQRDLSDPRVLQSIRQQLHDTRSQLLKAAYLENLRDQTKVTNYLAEQIFKDDAR